MRSSQYYFKLGLADAQGRRFTSDGGPALEKRLANTCERVAQEVRSIIPEHQLEAIVLGGGYGRGEGGVLRDGTNEQPYNDLEFYVFLRGNYLWQRRRFQGALHALSESLSPEAGVVIELKVDSLRRFQRSPISMFSYDLVARHRVVFGEGALLRDCGPHLAADKIPLAEATRLLFNRCSGLLLVRALLEGPALSNGEVDFAVRNLAKVKLALGDAVLTVFGLYHWSCRERRQRLAQFKPSETLPWLQEIQEHHAAGLEFKLHPNRGRAVPLDLRLEFLALSRLALEVWLWLESRRLEHPFSSAREYAFDARWKCPETTGWRNYLLTLRTFGLRAGLGSGARRYPRERLLNALALLLWEDSHLTEPRTIRRLQSLLCTPATGRVAMIGAYKRVWAEYG